jgi:hypothetical protein
MTENQQRIIDSLVNEFEKMNKPTSSNSGGLVDWDKLNGAKDKWLQTERDIELSNEAMRNVIEQTITDVTLKLRESLGHLFEIKIYRCTLIDNGCRWEFWAVKEPIKHEAFSVKLNVKKMHEYSDCRNFCVLALKSICFNTYAGNEQSQLQANTIEELFQNGRVTKTIMKYI